MTGLRKAQVKPLIIIAVLSVRYILSPLIGIGIVKAAANLGFLPADPLYHFVLMLQYTVPPAMNIGKFKMSSLLNLTHNKLIKLMFMILSDLIILLFINQKNAGTMTQLFDVAQEECSVLFMWTYLVAALALTIWSTVFMWLLS